MECQFSSRLVIGVFMSFRFHAMKSVAVDRPEARTGPRPLTKSDSDKELRCKNAAKNFDGE